MSVTEKTSRTARLRRPQAPKAATRAKYGEAIRACDNVDYIEYNVSQIARMFHLNPSSLCKQLRVHYPEIVERREQVRIRLGLNDNLPRGARRQSQSQYAEAVEHLRNSDDTIMETALLYGLSYSGLREHVLYYHKDIVVKRYVKRKNAVAEKKPGVLSP